MSDLTFTIGADPELFAKKGGQFVCGHSLIPGSKAEPFPVQNGAVQPDGFALEFNIDPALTEDQFLNNVNSVVGQLAAMVPDHELAAVPVAHFTKEYIALQPREAQELGCDPDFNAWTGNINEPPVADLPIRTGAGHVHVGWGENMSGHDEMAMMLIQQMDFFLGLPSLLFDGDTQRRSMYGQAGAFRLKPYGVEYRVLSNVWVGNPDLTRWVFRATMAAIRALTEGTNLADTFGDISGIINTSDVEAARMIIEAAGLEVPYVLQ